MTDPPPIADVPEALTPQWLTQALRSTGVLGDATVITAAVAPLGTGQMCDSVRVGITLDIDTDAPDTLVAKLPAANETSRATAMMLRNYEKEVRFYRELANGLDVRTPAVHYADLDATGSTFVLLLEDMAPSEQGDQLAGCSPVTAQAALRELVGLHAPRWGDDSLTELEWLYPDQDSARAMSTAMLPMLWDGFLERYGETLTDSVRVAGGQLFDNLADYLADPGGPSTVIHGDYRLDNLLLNPQTGDVTVVDWQTCTYGPAMVDVAYFIGAGLVTEDRRAHEDELVRGYHRDLCAAGVTDFDWEACWNAYRRGTWAGIIMSVGASMLVERTERGDQMFMAMASRHADHALDLDAVELLTA